VALFAQLVGPPADDRLLATPPVEEFLRLITGGARRELDPVIERMLRSPDPKTRQAGGRQAALAGLGDQAAGSLVETALQGDAQTRRGVAEVAAANIARHDVGPACEPWLLQLASDVDEDVREEAGRWAWNIETFDMGRFLDLASAYIETPSFEDDEGPLLRALEQSVDPVGDLAVRATGKFIKARGADVGNLQRRSAGYAETASKLAVRAYTSAASEEERMAALDVIDMLLAARVEDIRELLTAFN
jgi:hypothetical protein